MRFFQLNAMKIALIFLLSFSLLSKVVAENIWVQNLDETEIITQFHGNPETAQLRLFMAGNQIVMIDNLIAEFKKQYPIYNEIYYVTLPPGKELQWILGGGAEWRAKDFPNVQELVKPNPADPSSWYMRATDKPGVGFKMKHLPDVYTTVAAGHMNSLAAANLVEKYFTYTHNQLAIMAHTTQVSQLKAVAEDDTIIADAIDDGKPGFNAKGELTAEGLYRLLASNLVTVSEPDIKTQGIERHIWRMYVNATHAVYGCPASGHAVCSVKVNDVFPTQADNQAGMSEFFANESDNSLRKIVYFSKRFDQGEYANPADGTTFVTFVHHLDTPENIEHGVDIARLTVGPVWGTEVEFQQFRKDNPDIVALRVSNEAGPDGKALNRSNDVNYLAARLKNISEQRKDAAKDFLRFLKSPEAQTIYQRAGFIPATSTELNTNVYLGSDHD
ncbi:MAG: substrate-binding domain-containing protein [Gammaproteobacteria bacterium]|nr:substrate-binding domain-containing protein [Gammaproteobacteria bacterium]